jgi:glycosyltransferase involved in cell wall biosynthesis
MIKSDLSDLSIKNRVSVLMLIKTRGIVYDDRLRKESLSLTRAGEHVRILAVETANTAEAGVTDYGVPYTTVSLLSRRGIARAKGLAVKTAEMYRHFLQHVVKLRPRCVWVHNMEMAGLIPVLALLRRWGVIERIVWDHHELPSSGVLARAVTRRALRALCSIPDALIAANEQRLGLLMESGIVEAKEAPKWLVLDNFADETFATLQGSGLPEELREWLGGRDYLLAQGGAHPNRHFSALVEAVVEWGREPLVVVGGVNEEEVERLRARYPSLNAWVYFTGMIPQMDVVDYIDGASASVVLYMQDSENTWLCSPNRLYQALSRGCPVIVGNNPPMRAIVERAKCGVALCDDGRDPHSIVAGLEDFAAKQGELTRAAKDRVAAFAWRTQDPAVWTAAGVRAPHGGAVDQGIGTASIGVATA